MKNLLLLFVLAISFSTIAQDLFVRPTGVTPASDSYIYVNNEILFVTDDIELETNNTSNEEASIYLRNQAQLIQGGSGTLRNAGTGTISVIQDSHSDSYDYNFWSSPVGDPAFGSGAANRNFRLSVLKDSLTIKSSATSLNHIGFDGRGSGDGSNPLTNPLVISTRWIYSYPNGAWVRVAGTGQVTPGLGFTMKGTNVTTHANANEDPNNQKYDFRGRPNNGDITLTTVAGSTTLAGNPYPSTLDLNRFFWDDDNSEIDVLYFWGEDRTINSHLYVDNKGGYGTWVPGASDPNGLAEDPGNPGNATPSYEAGVYTVPTYYNYDSAGNQTTATGASGASYERRFAPIGQGLMIDTKTTGTGLGGAADPSNNQLIFKNSHRRYIIEGLINDSQFKSQSNYSTFPNRNNKSSEKSSMVRIYTEFIGSHYRDMVLIINDNTTFNYDRGFDGKHPNDGAGNDAYFPVFRNLGDTTPENFVIQGIPFDINMKLPFKLVVSKEREIQIKIAEVTNNIPEKIYLFDSLTNTYYNLHDEKGFKENLKPGNYSNRFYLVFDTRKVRSQIEEQEIIADEMFKTETSLDFFQNNRAAQLEVGNPEGFEITQAYMFDMGGKLVYQQSNLGNSTKISLPTGNLSDGVYIVKLTTDTNVIIDYKMTVINK